MSNNNKSIVMKKGFLVVDWSTGSYLEGLNKWTKDENNAMYFLNLETASHCAECHSFFCCHHFEVVYSDRSLDILNTVYRTSE